MSLISRLSSHKRNLERSKKGSMTDIAVNSGLDKDKLKDSPANSPTITKKPKVNELASKSASTSALKPPLSSTTRPPSNRSSASYKHPPLSSTSKPTTATNPATNTAKKILQTSSKANVQASASTTTLPPKGKEAYSITLSSSPPPPADQEDEREAEGEREREAENNMDIVEDTNDGLTNDENATSQPSSQIQASQTSQPQTSQPQTSQPQTSQPQTSQPQTSQPQISQSQPQIQQPKPITLEKKVAARALGQMGKSLSFNNTTIKFKEPSLDRSNTLPYRHSVTFAIPPPQQYSNAARAFILQFPFLPHHANVKDDYHSPSDFLNGGTYVADFVHSPAQAIEAYKDWKQSLWFAPESFLASLDPLALTPMWLPFYSFSLFTHSAHVGKVGYFRKVEAGEGSMTVARDFASVIEYDWADGSRSTVVRTQHHPDVLSYAPSQASTSHPEYEAVKEIWYWKLDELKQITFSQPQSLTHTLHLHQTKSFDVKAPHPSNFIDGWKYAKHRLHRNEHYCAAQNLKREWRCDIVDGVHTDTQFSHTVVKQVYLPVYVWNHTYDGTTYCTIMNAQNGLIYGKRPYRLKGSFESAIKVLTGGHFSQNICEVLKGVELATRDSFTRHASPYRPHLPYLLFPPSDQFLVFVAIGWLCVKNTSPSDPVEIVAQKRLSSEFGKALVLTPGSEKIVAYRGVWCFCVTKGDPDSILIAHVSTNSGSDKDDVMGMV